jgi:ribonuclease G
MSKELVIGSNRHETKVAILEEDQLVEVYFQRANEYSLAGSIHKGRVTRVLPGMQSAFVDLGLERDTFLYVSDFFEENEDIDTVVEDKPSRGNERRDRTPNDRGQNNRPIARPAFIRPVEAIPEAAPVVVEAPDDEIAEAIPSSESGPAVTASERATGERAEGFRGDRGRGRRSRRRKPRGRGIPENKYAQPGDTAAPQSAESAPFDEIAEEIEEPRDVIILPGESLAKYRRPVVAQGRVPEKRAPLNETSEPVLEEPEEPEESDPASEEELEEHAQEIELVDRVFSHHDDEWMVEEEQKLEDVRQDQPAASPFVVNDIESEEEREPAAEPPVESGSAEIRHGFSLESLEAPSVSASIPEETERSSESSERQIHEQSESEETEPVNERAPEGETLELDEFEGADLEDSGTAGPFDSESTGAAGSGPEPAVQTASVREQGGRFMHRASRRMRRRRGGNRFGQQEQQGQQGGAEGGHAAGAAVVAQPEARPESRGETRGETRGEYRPQQDRETSQETTDERSAEKPERVMPSISELLKAGQEIIVQIAKEPLGQKGARITSHIALPGRFVVFMPSVTHLGVSRKIASDEERQRLKRILQTHRAGTTGGFIVRTAGEGIPEDEIAADMNFLYTLWLDIRSKAEKKPAPALLHYDLDIVQRILRDQVTEEFKSIWVDNEDMYENVLSFMQRFQPAFVNRVKMYTRSAPVFDAFGITQELEKALRPKVWLKSGGYIVINQTEALVAIDINTGKYVGKSNRLEDTIVKTNTEAVKEIVRQIRLRDLGGIIVVDFIDMDERKNRQKVMQALEEAMREDKAPYKILQFNDFGLVAITRKRVKQSLERTLCSPCPYCEGAGYVKSVQTIIGEILVEAQKISKAIDSKDALLRVHPEVAKVLKANDNKYLEELEETLGRPVLVKSDPALHQEKFDLG